MRIIIRLCESSRHPTKGKHHFYICQNGSLKFCRINGENPDNIGVFTGYIYFVALLWCEKRDLNPYGVNHTPLKRARLPVPPLSHYAGLLPDCLDIISDFARLVNPFFNLFILFEKEFLPTRRETRYSIKRCAAAGVSETVRHQHSAGGIGHTRHIPQKNAVNPTENKENKPPQPPEEVFSPNTATPGGGRSKTSRGQARLRQCFRFIRGFHTGC